MINVFNVIKKSLNTEKGGILGAGGKEPVYAFVVDTKASKQDVKKAVEKLFSVKVSKVRTMVYPRKEKGYGNLKGLRAKYKKAYVCLKEGERIDMLTVK